MTNHKISSDKNDEQAREEMFKLSEFKKHMLVNELINGKVSRESIKIL